MGCWLSILPCYKNHDKVQKISIVPKNDQEEQFEEKDEKVIPTPAYPIENLFPNVIAARTQLDESEYGGRSHARYKHAGKTPAELLRMGGRKITSYLTREDQDKALASAMRNQRKNLSLGDTVRNIPHDYVATDRFPIWIMESGVVKSGFSSRLFIKRDGGRRNNNIVTVYPIPE